MAPRKAPQYGPNVSEPTITGMWTIVPFITGRLIKPNGVNARRKMTPVKMEAVTNFLIFVAPITPIWNTSRHLRFAGIDNNYTHKTVSRGARTTPRANYSAGELRGFVLSDII
jgi:hypothetical protein